MSTTQEAKKHQLPLKRLTIFSLHFLYCGYLAHIYTDRNFRQLVKFEDPKLGAVSHSTTLGSDPSLKSVIAVKELTEN